MTFQSTLGQLPPTVELLECGGECLAKAHVGYDLEGDKNFWIACGLSPSPLGPEFFFNLVVTTGDGDEAVIWESDVVAGMLTREHRESIRGALFHTVIQLFRHADPPAFFMTTYQAYLPDCAVEKYRHLCHLFGRFGYRVGRSDAYHGRVMWGMERSG